MKAAPKAVGVDNGGTWIRFVGLDAKGRRVWSLKKPSPSIQNLPAFLHRHLKRFHGTLNGLAVGSRRVWKPSARRSVKRDLRGLAKNIVVMSDVEAAWLAAFKSQGIIVISGTGSIAYGRIANGKFARAGGLGPDKGDEGSGYWIGKRWLEGRRLKSQGTMTVRNVAALAPAVIQKAKKKDPLACAIVQESHAALSDLVVQLLKTLKIKGETPISYSGSVLENIWFRSGFLRSLKKKGVTFRLIKKKVDPATALARSIMGHASR